MEPDNAGLAEIEQIPGLTAPEEPEAAPEVVAEPEAREVVEAPPERKTVPLEALHEERKKRQEQAREIADVRQKLAQFLESQKKPPEPIPPPDQDPVGHFDARLKQQEQFRQEQERYMAEQRQAQEVHSHQQRFVSAYHDAARSFASQQPDFGAAYQHVLNARAQELQVAGYDVNTAKYMVAEEERFLVAKAFEDGANPAERMYQLAKARGYRVPSDRLETVDKGIKAKSLSGGGATPKEPDSLEAIMEITDDREFLAAFSKFSDKH